MCRHPPRIKMVPSTALGYNCMNTHLSAAPSQPLFGNSGMLLVLERRWGIRVDSLVFFPPSTTMAAAPHQWPRNGDRRTVPCIVVVSACCHFPIMRKGVPSEGIRGGDISNIQTHLRCLLSLRHVTLAFRPALGVLLQSCV